MLFALRLECLAPVARVGALPITLAQRQGVLDTLSVEVAQEGCEVSQLPELTLDREGDAQVWHQNGSTNSSRAGSDWMMRDSCASPRSGRSSMGTARVERSRSRFSIWPRMAASSDGRLSAWRSCPTRLSRVWPLGSEAAKSSSCSSRLSISGSGPGC